MVAGCGKQCGNVKVTGGNELGRQFVNTKASPYSCWIPVLMLIDSNK